MSTPTQLTFLTDYGLEHKFLGVCRGVIQRIAPGAQVLDITHLVPPGDIRHGAVVLAQSIPYLPPAVHLAIVDPGVGTARRPVVLVAGEHLFVGPDNGLLLWATDLLDTPLSAYEISDPEIWIEPRSSTFHGRDLFAPAAAHLAAGRKPDTVGPEVPVAELVRLPDPVRSIGADSAEGEVLTVDRFGNIQTSLPMAELRAAGVARDEMELVIDGTSTRLPLVHTFGSVPDGALLAHEDSAQLLSIAVNLGDAAARLDLTPGKRFRLRAV